jgi:hypothetical protein
MGIARPMLQLRPKTERAEEMRQRDIARRQGEIERQELAIQIKEEEKKLANLDSWVTNWVRAQQVREFIVALERFG